MVPNLLTLGNLISGCLSMVFVFQEKPMAAIICIGISLLLDFLDGLIARMLQVSSDLGIQLDSLADVVSFGVAPAMMMFDVLSSSSNVEIISYLAFIFPAFGAYRLARFNIQQTNSAYFQGLPIPAAATYFCGLFWLRAQSGCSDCSLPFDHPIFIVVSLIILSFLMVSQLPHFSFKLKSFIWRGNEFPFFYIILVALSLPFLKVLTVSFSIVLYIFLSLIWSNIKFKR